jgi:hypothetical protein
MLSRRTLGSQRVPGGNNVAAMSADIGKRASLS